MKEATVKDGNCTGYDEIYAPFYACPSCGEDRNAITPYDKYCSECGIKLVWDLSEGHIKEQRIPHIDKAK